VHDFAEDEGRAIAWSDVTDHPHAFAVVRVLTDTPEELRWIDEIGRELFLKPLTLAGYNAVCKYFGLPPERSIAAVHAAVLTSLSAGH
jgi:predicted solute-binding protein